MSRNDWLFAIFGWDPEYERKVPRKRKIQLAFWSVIMGAALGGLAIKGILSVPRDERWWMYIVLVIGVVGLSGYNWILRRELIDRLDLQADQQAASQIQQRLVPSTLPEVPGFELAHHYSPFHLVGGDYYDAILLDDRHLMLTMADVSGKGTGAALLTANLQALLRFSKAVPDRLGLAVAAINEHLVAHTEDKRFVTLVLAILDVETKRLTYVNAGHNAPLGANDDGSTFELSATGLPLGSFAGVEYPAGVVELTRGTTLAFYTDGLSERANRDGEMYGEARIVAALRGASGRPATTVLRALVQDSEHFSSGRSRDDDTAVLVIRAT